MTLNVGDKAIFTRYRNGNDLFGCEAPASGTVVEIISGPIFNTDYVDKVGYRYRCSIGDRDCTISCLRKIEPSPPQQTREEVGEWDLCPWRPQQLPVSEEAMS